MKYFKLFEDYHNNFNSWFHDSKVVDTNGNPLIVYHGTHTKFDKFDKSKIGENWRESINTGFFFSQSEEKTINYVKQTFKDGGYVLKCYLQIKNPLVRKVNSEYVPTTQYFDKNSDELMNEIRSTDSREEWGDLYDDERLDGIIIQGTKNDNLYVAFEPEQIKLVGYSEKYDSK